MEFLDNYILPQSAEHIELLHYMLILIFFLFIPFISVIFGGTALSLRYKRKAERTGDNYYLQFAKDVIEIVTVNKSVGVILGVAPLITAILIYAQLLHTSEISNLKYLALSLILITAALVLIYNYRYSLSFNKIFESIERIDEKNGQVQNELEKFSKESRKISRKAGGAGLILLFLGIWIFIAAITIPSLYTEWKSGSIISSLFSLNVVIRFLYYFCTAFALTGGMVLFSFFEANSKKYKDEKYKEFIRVRGVRYTFIFAVILPLLIAINLLLIPGSALSSSVFVYTLISILLLFLGYHFLYLLTKKAKGTIAALLFFTLIFSVAAYIISDQKTMKNSTKVHSAVLAGEFEKYLANLKGEETEEEINGEEIYKVSCSACHRFDQKLVGPAHNDVLPKYVGKEAQLIAFIRNPSKVNPDFPPMPNPGLKPKEAEAVAKYLLSTFEANK